MIADGGGGGLGAYFRDSNSGVVFQYSMIYQTKGLSAPVLSMNFYTFKKPKNRLQGINSASLCSLAGRYDNPLPTRFLAPVDCLQSPALHFLWNNSISNEVIQEQPPSRNLLATVRRVLQYRVQMLLTRGHRFGLVWPSIKNLARQSCWVVCLCVSGFSKRG